MTDRQLPLPMPAGWTAVLDEREGYRGVSAEWREPGRGGVTVTVRLGKDEDPAQAVMEMVRKAGGKL